MNIRERKHVENTRNQILNHGLFRIGLFEAIAIVGTAWATAVAQIIRRPSLEDDMAERRRQADEYGRELDDEAKRVNRETRKNRRANWVAVEMLPYWQNGNKKTNRRG